jgi:hypothetical protein
MPAHRHDRERIAAEGDGTLFISSLGTRAELSSKADVPGTALSHSEGVKLTQKKWLSAWFGRLRVKGFVNDYLW